MKMNDIMILGGLAIGAYLLFKFFSSSQQGGGGGGGGDGLITPVIPEAPPDITYTAMGTPVYHSQAWTGASFGQRGQPSIAFRNRTLQQAQAGIGGYNTYVAGRAIAMGTVPPRMIAKIKAGKVW